MDRSYEDVEVSTSSYDVEDEYYDYDDYYDDDYLDELDFYRYDMEDEDK